MNASDTVQAIANNHPSMTKWLGARMLLLTKHGSHAYGLNTATSDLDIKGIVVPPRTCILGFQETFEQAEGKLPEQNAEYVVYELRKFLKLAADCNPNIIELLFTDDADLLYVQEWGEYLREHRSLFLTKKAKHTFSGYAMSQLKRIRTHNRWLLDPPKAPPTRAEFGLPERTVIPADQLAAAQAEIRKQLDRWSFKEGEDMDPSTRVAVQESMSRALSEMKIGSDEQFRAAGRLLSYDDNFLELLDRERHWNARQTEWTQYQSWKKNRNPARAELEAKHGYDTKHAMHLVRLMRMCREILAEGTVRVKRRHDREELLAIRNGAWKYEDLIGWAEKQDTELEALYHTSTLPRAPSRGDLDRICMTILEDVLEFGMMPGRTA